MGLYLYNRMIPGAGSVSDHGQMLRGLRLRLRLGPLVLSGVSGSGHGSGFASAPGLFRSAGLSRSPALLVSDRGGRGLCAACQKIRRGFPSSGGPFLTVSGRVLLGVLVSYPARVLVSVWKWSRLPRVLVSVLESVKLSGVGPRLGVCTRSGVRRSLWESVRLPASAAPSGVLEDPRAVCVGSMGIC